MSGWLDPATFMGCVDPAASRPAEDRARCSSGFTYLVNSHADSNPLNADIGSCLCAGDRDVLLVVRAGRHGPPLDLGGRCPCYGMKTDLQEPWDVFPGES